MRRLALLIAGAAVWLLLAVPVFADNGPHQQGTSGATTDSCSGCHRAHTARAAGLLANPSQTSLCYTCHGTTGTGATTDVQDGVQYVPIIMTKLTTVTRGPTVSGGLRGGGFDNAVIDTGLTQAGPEVGVLTTPVSTTSSHAVGATGTAWGNGAIGSGPGPTISMTCGSCHDPHGNGNYRILKPVPDQSGATTGVTIPDVASTYMYTTLDYWQPGDPFAPQYASNVTAWCSTCHTRYMAPNGSGRTPSGDPIYNYRHTTTNGFGLQCVKCHVSHGSNASMGTNSQAVPWPGSSTPRGTDSNLLRINNRGTCQKCHNK